MTVSDSDFLAGKDGKAVTVAGQLRVAQGTGKLPVVILMHGSGGMGAQLDTWSRLFNAMGVSTFAIDGFTGRGLTSVNTNQAELGRLNFILDIYRRARHPRQASARRSAAHRPDGLLARRAGRALRQPDALSQDVEQVGRVVRGLHPVLSGLRDELHRRHRCRRSTRSGSSTASPTTTIRCRTCKAFLARLKSAGRDVELTEYADAQHGFDTPLGPPVVVAKGAQTVRACTIKEGPAGVLVNTATGAPFAYTDACVQLDPHVGRNAAAATAAQAAVGDFVRTLFKLK